MRLERTIHRDKQVFDAIPQVEWNSLLPSSATNVVFLTWEWQSTWWNHMQPGELLVVSYRDDNKQLQGLVPMFVSQTGDGLRTLSIIGCEEVSDYLDMIVSKEFEEEICLDLLMLLTSEAVPKWDEIRMCNLPQDSTACRAFAETARRAEMDVQTGIQARCPVITLPATWEEYLERLDKKQRHEIRRKIRRAESQVNTRWYVVSDPTQDIARAMERFFELHRLSSPDKDVFMDDNMRAFFMDIAYKMAEQRWLSLSFIEMDGHEAAGLLSFDYNSSLQVYNSGYSPEHYGFLSPGIVLMAYCIRYAIEMGHHTFDFLRGEEEYKYRMGASPVELYELTISRRP